MFEGQGGNITVAVGTDGRRHSQGRYAVRAAARYDQGGGHVEGKALFREAGATIVAHDNLLMAYRTFGQSI
jgi:hypothetical protein